MTTYQVLKKYGWRQRFMGSTDTGFCLLGAFLHAHPRARAAGAGSKLRALAKAAGCRNLSACEIVQWNDETGRTKKAVLAVAKNSGV